MRTIADMGVAPGLVASATAGDDVAFARIVAAHHDDMVRVAYLVTAELELAHDAVQLAWPIAWRKLPTLRDTNLLRPWLVTIAANEARGLLRRRNRRRLTEITVETWNDRSEPRGSRLDERDRTIDLRNALQRLSPEDRSVVAMRYVLGLSSSEIGRTTGLSATGVRSRLARAVDRLRKDLGDD